MIADAFITQFLSIINWLLGYFPSADPQVLTNIHTWSGYMQTYVIQPAGFILPMNELLWFIRLVIAIELLVNLFKVIRWILSILTLGVIK